jgi:hypothetical protein
MKLSNFTVTKFAKTVGPVPVTVIFGTVDVATGMLWWRRLTTRVVFKEFGRPWIFDDDGSMVGRPISDMAAAYAMKRGRSSILECAPK